MWFYDQLPYHAESAQIKLNIQTILRKDLLVIEFKINSIDCIFLKTSSRLQGLINCTDQ
jgi:hypothetical protein